jgi:hypothetical protein
MAKLEDAQDAMLDLREAISTAFQALENLEGVICDTDILDGLVLDWRNGEPQINKILEQLALTGATYEESI